jgi:tripartite ATP-independent transporter DctM subunit
MVVGALIFLFVILFALILLKVPVAYSVGIATTLTLILFLPFLPALTTVMQQMTTGIDSFTLLAIPFFILAGDLMNQGGIAHRLIRFSKSLLGSLPGGLLYVNIVSAIFFGAVSGSAVASASAIGGILGKTMGKEGYKTSFTASVNITASTIGLVIPPSNVLIVYALASAGEASVQSLFLAGYFPGILMGIALMVVTGYYAHRFNFPKGNRISIHEILTSFYRAFLSLLMIIVVVGGIVLGVFTATEGAVIAVIYALILGFYYGQLTLKKIPKILIKSSKTTAIVMFLICTSMALSWLFAFADIPDLITNYIRNSFESPVMIVLIINIILLVVGTFMDITPALLIFTPMFLPLVTSFGMHPVHFGIIMVVNLCIGLCTPPVGTLLFVGSGVANIEMTKVIKPIIPFLIAMMVILVLITYIPEITLYLPKVFGLIK